MKLKKLLIIDDNTINRSILTKILSSEYDIIEAENGLDGLEVLGKTYKEVSAVILDIKMPVMDGFEFLEQKSKNHDYDTIPVIITTDSDESENEIKALNYGAWDFISKPYKPEIIKIRIRNVVARSKMSFFTQLKHLADFDTLTGIHNKTKFFANTKELLSANPDKKFAFMRFDIDRFSLVNSFFGMDDGDKLLCYFAKCIKSTAEAYAPSAYGRINADVFGICIPISDEKELYNINLRFRAAIKSYELDYDLFPNCGVYIINDSDTPINTIFDNSTLAAKSCKNDYIIGYAVYNESMLVSVKREQLITNAMYDSLKKKSYKVFLQPIYALKENKLYGAEALVRWDNPPIENVSPGEFIPIFERNGFITRFDLYMWDNVCSLLKKWNEQKKEDIPISVNVSRVNMHNPHFIKQICEITGKYGISNSLLHLELTESAYIEDPKKMIQTVTELRELGFMVMMDDFGSGYSSLNILKDIPVDMLKIDMKFLAQTDNTERSNKIIASIIKMAKDLNIQTIAEGVETEEQTEFLRSVGCGYAQGFHLSRPMPSNEYEMLLSL